MKRGDIIIAVFSGDYGKPRPSLVVQSDRLGDLESFVICPLTSDLADALPVRIAVEPSAANGLERPSHVMVDKLSAVSATRCRDVVGSLDAATMALVDQRLLLLLGLAD